MGGEAAADGLLPGKIHLSDGCFRGSAGGCGEGALQSFDKTLERTCRRSGNIFRDLRTDAGDDDLRVQQRI